MAAPLAKAFFAQACARLHESSLRKRKRARIAERNLTARVRELRTKHSQRKRATEIRFESAELPQRAGSAQKRARRRNKIIVFLLSCPLLLVASEKSSNMDARSSQESSESPRYHFYLPRRSKIQIFHKNLVRKARSIRGARNSKNAARND